jgi:hypothetical protein
MGSSQGRTVRLYFAALAAYLAIAAVCTFPLITKFATYFPGNKDNNDVFAYIWNNWWTYFAVAHLHAKPYLTEYIFATFQIDLRLHTLGLLYGLCSIPALPLLGPVAVLNAQVFLTIALNGVSSFRFAHYLTRSKAIGFLSGLMIASSPAINFHLATGRPSCAALWPAICVLYFGLRLLDTPGPSLTACLAVSVVATLLADQLVVLFCGFWLVVLLVPVVLAQRRELLARRFLLAVATVLLISAPPAYLLYWRPLTRVVGYTVPSVSEALTYSIPPGLFASPSFVWHTYGVLPSLALVVGCVLARRYPELWPWVLGSVGCLVLTMGPVVHGTKFPLPFALIRTLPGLSQFRTPYRFQIPAAIGMAVTAGITLSRLLGSLSAKTGRRMLSAVAVLLAGEVVAHRLADGFPIQTMPPEPFYAEIARDPRDCLVLDIPVGVQTGTDRIGSGQALIFYQPVHHKRLISGYVSRAPLAALDYYRKSPALMLLANETPPPGDLEADLIRRIDELHVGYVVVHPGLVDGDRLGRIMELLNRTVDLVRLPSTGDLVAFKRTAKDA